MTTELGDRLHAGLLARGYVVESTLDSPEAFGSWYRDYVRGDRRLRLVWDGRDQWFVLQGGRQWGDVAVQRPDELAAAGIDAFLEQAD